MTVDQLRWVQNGYKVRVTPDNTDVFANPMGYLLARFAWRFSFNVF
jgi:hypothetical protein